MHHQYLILYELYYFKSHHVKPHNVVDRVMNVIDDFKKRLNSYCHLTTQINHSQYFYCKTLSPNNEHCTLYLRYIAVECIKILNAVWHQENFYIVHTLNHKSNICIDRTGELWMSSVSALEKVTLRCRDCTTSGAGNMLQVPRSTSMGFSNSQPIRLALSGTVVYTTQTG